MTKKTDLRDAWDEHWTDLNDITELNPAQHYRQSLLLGIVLDCAKLKNNSGRFFDFGSGQGDLIAMLNPHLRQMEFSGLELSQVGVEISKKKVPSGRFYQCNLLDSESQMPELFNQADMGTCAEVLEHIDEPQKAIENMKKYLAPGALLVLTVPGGPMNEFEKRIGHRKHYSSGELERLARDAGLEVVQSFRSGFPFFNIYKLMAFLRGKKLLSDTSGDGQYSRLMLLVLKTFDWLFRFNIKKSPFGWQLVLVAKNPS